MSKFDAFKALTVETLPARLGGLEAMRSRLGDAGGWKVREVGDGNLNLVFIVEGGSGGVVVKQALPYVRLVGDSWPLPLKRSFFEYHALTRQEARNPGSAPQIFHFDETQALIVMEYLSPHIILRRGLIAGHQYPKIGRDLGLFMARTLFRGSDFHMETRQRKADLALFADNVELCDITESLVFSDPYFDAKMNRHTSPQLDGLVAELRADRDLKVEAQRLKHLFTANAETLVHGDLHTGSIMVTEADTRMIDPEFAFYGPMAFDVGMALANFWMSFFSQRGHETAGNREQHAYISARRRGRGMVGIPRRVLASLAYRANRHPLSEEPVRGSGRCACRRAGARPRPASLFDDMLGFAGIECHRRILGLAHNADFESIEDLDMRASCEAKALRFGRHLVVNRRQIHGIEEVNNLARLIEKEKSL